MQRLAGDFMVGPRIISTYTPQGNIVDLYQLPSGQWQYGKGRDAVVITSLDQVVLVDKDGNSTIDPDSLASIKAWIKLIQDRPTPTAVQQGMTPVIEGQTSRDQLSHAISKMSDENVNRILNAIVQTMGPIADSINQGEQVNSHSDGYGQDQGMYPPGAVQMPAAFHLPPGARWADPRNPASGYLTFDSGITDELGKPASSWHPTPEFHALLQQPDPTPITETTPLKVHDPVQDEMERDSELTGAARTSSRRRR